MFSFTVSFRDFPNHALACKDSMIKYDFIFYMLWRISTSFVRMKSKKNKIIRLYRDLNSDRRIQSPEC